VLKIIRGELADDNDVLSIACIDVQPYRLIFCRAQIDDSVVA